MRKITFFCVVFMISLFNSVAQQQYYDTAFGDNGRVTTPGTDQSSTLKILKHNESVYAFIYSTTDGYIIRKYGIDGIFDTNFSINIISNIYYWSSGDAFQAFMEVTDDEKLLVGTHSLTVDGNDTALYNLCRYTLDGAVDTGYGNNGYASMAIEGGEFTMNLLNVDHLENNDYLAVGYTNLAVVVNKFDSNGNRYTNVWDNGSIRYNIVQSENYAIQSCYAAQDNCVYVAFSNRESNFSLSSTIVKLDLNTGLPDPGFGTGGTLTLNEGEMFYRFTVDNDDKLLVATIPESGIAAHMLYKYNSDGTLVTGFGTNGFAHIIEDGVEIKQIAVGEDNSITILTENYYENGMALFKLNADGTADTAFGVDGKIAREEELGPNGTSHWVFDYLETEDAYIAAGSYRPGNSYLSATLFKFLKEPAINATPVFKPAGLTLYPNPARGMVYLDTASPISKADVLTVTGQLVLSARPDNNHIDVSTLSQGCYIINVYDDSGKLFAQKLVKE